MADNFSGLGLSDAATEAARAAGFDAPTPLQAAAIQLLRRGSNVLLHASSGAGVTAAFGLPLLDRLAESSGAADAADDGPRALVLAPTLERAQAVASALAKLAAGTKVAVRATAPGWRTSDAVVLVTTPERALLDVQSSALKLGSVQTLVVLQVSDIFTLGAGEALGTLATLVPREAQRVVTSREIGGAVDRFIEAQAKRPLVVPPRAADPKPATSTPAAGQIGYLVVTEAEKADTLARLLVGADEALVHARTEARAEQVERELATRGIMYRGGPRVAVRSFISHAGTSARIVSYDVPFAADDLRRLHETGGTVLVTVAELPHLQRIAADAAFTLKHRRARDLDESALAGFRATVREALDVEDLHAQMLVLEPLLEEHSANEVAAALSALLRRRAPPAAAPSTAATGAPPKEAAAGEFTRLFISIGARDNIRPGDLVGAITGEAGIKGDQVGRVDIRDSFSVVEVMTGVAEKVIRALNGTTMRGRSLRVDFDRKVGGGSAERGREGGRESGRGGPRPRPGRS
ncbi:MAG: DEAD/DEAH box helicase [Gemmatimonadota bacterium]